MELSTKINAARCLLASVNRISISPSPLVRGKGMEVIYKFTAWSKWPHNF